MTDSDRVDSFFLEAHQRKWCYSRCVVTQAELTFFIRAPDPSHTTIVHDTDVRLTHRAVCSLAWHTADTIGTVILAKATITPDEQIT